MTSPQGISMPFHSGAAGPLNGIRADRMVDSWFASGAREEALAEMCVPCVPAEPVYHIADAVTGSPFRDSQVLGEVEDPEFGPMPMHSIVSRLPVTPSVGPRGQHADQVLCPAGFKATSIAGLCVKGACA
ncbi:CoA transferase [Caballeronia concitans]|jgi:crotonobetainyl-CoA:carnitine CoA-transferase CaiB-like acyl-CoA transferase|nr:CoA transferase [Caballeronia concitans]